MLRQCTICGDKFSSIFRNKETCDYCEQDQEREHSGFETLMFVDGTPMVEAQEAQDIIDEYIADIAEYKAEIAELKTRYEGSAG